MAPLAFGLAYPGFLLLSLAMDRHHRELLRGVPSRPRQRLYRTGGWALIGLSIWPCFAHWGWPLGLVAWCGALTLAALPLVVLMTYAPRAALRLAPLIPVAGLLACLAFA